MKIKIPEKKEVLTDGVVVKLAPKGDSWSQECLGEYASKVGVYIFHHDTKIKYVGKTNGSKMSFGMRLRRHLQETAAGKKHTYPKFLILEYPPDLKVKMYSLEDIKKLIDHKVTNVNELDLIPLFESALIVALKPEFQC